MSPEPQNNGMTWTLINIKLLFLIILNEFVIINVFSLKIRSICCLYLRFSLVQFVTVPAVATVERYAI